MNVRVYALVKELKAEGIEVTNKEMVDRLKGMGLSVASHSSSIDEETAKKIRNILLESKDSQVAPSAHAKESVGSKVDAKAKAPAKAEVKSPGETPSPSKKEAGAKTKAKVGPKTRVRKAVQPREKASSKDESPSTRADSPAPSKKGTKDRGRVSPRTAAKDGKPDPKPQRKAKPKTPVFKRFQIKKPAQKTEAQKPTRKDDRRGGKQ